MTEVAPSPIIKETEVVAEPTPTNGTDVVENGAQQNTNENNTTNGINGDEKKTPDPIDPKEDPLGWLKQQSSNAVHKVNFHILTWVLNHVEGENVDNFQLPRKGNLDFITRSQFINFLRDGQVLARLANKFSPGFVEVVHEGEAAKEKQNQVANVEGFIKFVKEKAAVADEHVFSVEDLQERGKAGYDAVVNTLFQLAFRAQETFNQPGFNLEVIIEEVSKVVDPNFFKKFVNIFQAGLNVLTAKLARNQSTEKVKDAEANGTEDSTNAATETEVKKAENASNPTEAVAPQ